MQPCLPQLIDINGTDIENDTRIFVRCRVPCTRGTGASLWWCSTGGRVLPLKICRYNDRLPVGKPMFSTLSPSALVVILPPPMVMLDMEAGCMYVHGTHSM